MPATRRGGAHWLHHDHVRRGAPTRLHRSAYPAALAGGPRLPATGDLAGARRPRQRAVREVAAPPAGNAVLVAGRVAEPAGLPALSRPHRPDGAVHLLRPGVWRPVHRPAVEVLPGTTGDRELRCSRPAQQRGAAAEAVVVRSNSADGVRAVGVAEVFGDKHRGAGHHHAYPDLAIDRIEDVDSVLWAVHERGVE